MPNSKERLIELIQELDCIGYGSYPLASGRVSKYKIFCDALFENKESRVILTELGYDMLRGNENYEIIGIVTGGYEFAKLVAEKAGKEAIEVDVKNNTIRGKIKEPNGIIFDDVLTKGKTIKNAKSLIISQYPLMMLEKAKVIADRLEGGKTKLLKVGIETESILTKDEIIKKLNR